MPTARKQLVCLDSTKYYHCVSRCVRRSFLCGQDTLTGKSYEHRRSWIEKKIYSLASSFCVDICAYAVMSNHYHLVVYIDKNEAERLTLHEVVERWSKDHKLPPLLLKWKGYHPLNKTEKEACEGIIEKWRIRLYSLSWFMKELNYEIACKANNEDECRGHFWESRFKSQALLDEQALISAMAYVDLNPVRAGIEHTPETSEFTSIKTRVEAQNKPKFTNPKLAVFINNPTNKMQKGIPFRLIDYIDLVDWSARQYRDDKATISTTIPHILERLSMTPIQWLNASSRLASKRVTMIGCSSNFENHRRLTKRKRACGYSIDIN